MISLYNIGYYIALYNRVQSAITNWDFILLGFNVSCLLGTRKKVQSNSSIHKHEEDYSQKERTSKGVKEKTVEVWTSRWGR